MKADPGWGNKLSAVGRNDEETAVFHEVVG